MTPERLAEIENAGIWNDLEFELLDACKDLMRDQEILIKRRSELAMETLRLEAENTRLREALQHYATLSSPNGDYRDTRTNHGERARKALEGK